MRKVREGKRSANAVKNKAKTKAKKGGKEKTPKKEGFSDANEGVTDAPMTEWFANVSGSDDFFATIGASTGAGPVQPNPSWFVPDPPQPQQQEQSPSPPVPDFFAPTSVPVPVVVPVEEPKEEKVEIKEEELKKEEDAPLRGARVLEAPAAVSPMELPAAGLAPTAPEAAAPPRSSSAHAPALVPPAQRPLSAGPVLAPAPPVAVAVVEEEKREEEEPEEQPKEQPKEEQPKEEQEQPVEEDEPLFSITFGGKTLTVHNDKAHAGKTLLRIAEAAEKEAQSEAAAAAELRALREFPGPLGADSDRAAVAAFARARALQHVCAGGADHLARMLLWETLAALVQCAGDTASDAFVDAAQRVLSKAALLEVPIVDDVDGDVGVDGHDGDALLQKDDEKEEDKNKDQDKNEEVKDALQEVEEQLEQFEDDEAVRVAVSRGEWAAALVLAAEISPAAHERVVRAYAVRGLKPGEPLRARLLAQQGRLDALFARPTAPLLRRWARNAALLLTLDGAAPRAALGELGDRLWARAHAPVLAHVCYVLAGHAPLPWASANARVRLLGADHRRAPRAPAPLDALQASECYYCAAAPRTRRTRAHAAFQLARLLAAHRLAARGLAEPARAYCRALLDCAADAPHLYPANFAAEVVQLQLGIQDPPPEPPLATPEAKEEKKETPEAPQPQQSPPDVGAALQSLVASQGAIIGQQVQGVRTWASTTLRALGERLAASPAATHVWHPAPEQQQQQQPPQPLEPVLPPSTQLFVPAATVAAPHAPAPAPLSSSTNVCPLSSRLESAHALNSRTCPVQMFAPPTRHRPLSASVPAAPHPGPTLFVPAFAATTARQV